WRCGGWGGGGRGWGGGTLVGGGGRGWGGRGGRWWGGGARGWGGGDRVQALALHVLVRHRLHFTAEPALRGRVGEARQGGVGGDGAVGDAPAEVADAVVRRAGVELPPARPLRRD
ncbi:unnamed protein product, partial [Lampetra fluviatilis]